jgi:asparagine synthase (glutamine-hydrolysing)
MVPEIEVFPWRKTHVLAVSVYPSSNRPQYLKSLGPEAGGFVRLLGREPVKQLLYLWIKSVFANYHLAADRVDMAHGVEVRLPFLDHVVFEFVSQIPGRVLAKNGREKYLLRKVAEPFVLPSTCQRDKKPSLAPPFSPDGRDRLSELVQDLLRSERFANVPFFDRPEVLSLLDRMPEADGRKRGFLESLLLVIASTSILHHHYQL